MKKAVVKVLSIMMATLMGVTTVVGTMDLSAINALANETDTPVELSAAELENLYQVINREKVSVHDPSIVVGTDKSGEKCYYIFGSHMAWAKSYDLETWTTFENNINRDYNDIFSNEKDWSALGNDDYDLSGNLWAPDIIYNKKLGKWCMYMSVNGEDWNSSICMLTADSLEGDWTYVGTVIYSGFGTDAQDYTLTDYCEVTGDSQLATRYTNSTSNWYFRYGAHAIDPCVFYDEDGNLWMSYGSWSGGIYMIALDENTGFRDKTHSYSLESGKSDPYMGIKLGGSTASGEASYISYKNE